MPVPRSPRRALAYPILTVLAAKVFEVTLGIFKGVFIRGKGQGVPDAPTVVLLEPFQLGDVLALSVMLDPILEKYPKARIVVWCHTRNRQVYECDSRIYATIDAPFPWSERGNKRGTLRTWKAVLATCKLIRKLGPSVAIDTRGDVRSQACLVIAGCPVRIGYKTYAGSNIRLWGLLLTDVVSDPPSRHRYLTNLHVLAPLLHTEPQLSLPALKDASPVEADPPDQRQVLIHPGAGWKYRLWAVENWVSLIDNLGQMDSVKITLLSGPAEAELAEQIGRAVSGEVTIVRTTYTELIGHLQRADLFIGLDSGPMNAAALLNVPVIALFGPGESTVWRPLSDRSVFFHHIEQYPCHPCTQVHCLHPERSCMTTITVHEVLKAARDILTAT